MLTRCKEDANADDAKASEEKQTNGLDLEITENGGNLSSGER